MAAIGRVFCARCLKEGHTNDKCHLAFYRKETIAEERHRLRAEKAAKDVAWKARQAEREQQQAEWQEKQAANKAAWEARLEERRLKREAIERRQAAAKKRREAKALANQAVRGDCETDSTMTSTEIDEEEVARTAAASKRVLRAEKKLREVEKLEALLKTPDQKLDKLQLEKLGRKRQFEIERMAAWAVAKGEARAQIACR